MANETHGYEERKALAKAGLWPPSKALEKQPAVLPDAETVYARRASQAAAWCARADVDNKAHADAQEATKVTQMASLAESESIYASRREQHVHGKASA